MTKYIELKGGTIQATDTDPEVYLGAWSSGGNINTGRNDSSGAGTSSAGLMIGGNSPDNSIVESYDGTSWTEVGNTSTATMDLGSGGTTVAALGFGGQPGFQTITEEWDAGQNVKVITD